MVVAWDLPNPISGGFWLDNPSRSGGVAFNGGEQIVASLAMRWRAKWIIPIRTNSEVLAARAFFDKLQGRAEQVMVPTFDGQRAPWPVDFAGRILNPRATRHPRLDGTDYEDDEIPDPSFIDAELMLDMADRATTCFIEMTTGSAPRPGQYFGVGVRTYRINAVAPSVSPAGGYEVNFLPPSRGGIGHSAGNTVSFRNSDCLMRQMTDDQGIKELEMMRRTELDLEFVEDV
jgi:hypothetical protein